MTIPTRNSFNLCCITEKNIKNILYSKFTHYLWRSETKSEYLESVKARKNKINQQMDSSPIHAQIS